MSIISKLPKKVNEWLIQGQRLGLLTEKQKNDFIGKYISLRQAGRPEVKFRKPRTIIDDGLDKGLEQFYNQTATFENGEALVKNLRNITGSIHITESMLYHRLQKLVDKGILTKIHVDGSKKVLYGRANMPINKS